MADIRPGVRTRSWGAGPAAIGVALFAVTGALLLRASTARTDGHLVYALDDAYIHLAIARNLVRHAVWGVTPAEFTAASSSPLWTALLAATALFLPASWQEAMPLVLNVVFGVALVIAAARTLAVLRLPAWLGAGVLALLVLATPLAPMAMAGMEHLLHAALFLAALSTAGLAIAGDARAGRDRAVRWCLILAPLAVLARFESLFLFAAAAALLALRGRWKTGGALALLALLPVALTAAVQLGHGGFWLPNSLVAKSQLGALGVANVPRLAGRAWAQAVGAPWLGALVAAAAACWVAGLERRARFWDLPQVLLLLFGSSAAIHLFLANVGWFYRYEAYLVAAGIVAVAGGVWALASRWPRGVERRRLPALTLAAVIAVSGWTLAWLGTRAGRAHRETPHASRHIYLQQYQMGRFLGQQYRGAGVVANDIGAISYLADLRLVDLLGLATTEMLRKPGPGETRAGLVARVAAERHAEVAVIYDRWRGDLPAGWVRVAALAMAPAEAHWNSRLVGFYAATPQAGAGLLRRLRAFAPSLPSGAWFDFSGKVDAPLR
jgi:hypothetical protein